MHRFAEALSRFPAERGNLEGKERGRTETLNKRTSGPRAERLAEWEGLGLGIVPGYRGG
jgi:hypothetical protein